MSASPPQPPDPAAPRDRLTGIALLIGAMVCFSLLDSCAKWLSPRIGAIETTWFRYVTAMIFAVAILNPARVPQIARTRAPWLQAARSVALMFSSLLNFMAIKDLQLSQAIAINFLMPLLVAVMAGPILGEWIGARRLAAVGAGFFGVLIVTRPWTGLIEPGMLWAVAAAFAYAVYAILTRMLAGRDTSDTTNLYSSVAPVLLIAPVIPWLWINPPSGYAWLLIALTGLFGGGGHFLLVAAYKRVEAPRLAPFGYVQIIFMTLAGWVFFSEIPDRWTLAGAAVVIASGLYLLHRERVVGPRKKLLGD